MADLKDFSIIIPARYASTRFPGKPLELINGKPMVIHVWEKSCKALPPEQVYIATDCDKINDICLNYGAQVIMTTSDCLTGTDRISQAAKKIKTETVINVQGDEPLIDPEDIKKVIKASQANPEKIINAYCEITSVKSFISKNTPKVVFSENGKLLYMSRAAIPSPKSDQIDFYGYRQVCIYAFPKKYLAYFGPGMSKSNLEKIEDIEIIRLLEKGIDIKMIKVNNSIAVDTPEDLKLVNKELEKRNAEHL